MTEPRSTAPDAPARGAAIELQQLRLAPPRARKTSVLEREPAHRTRTESTAAGALSGAGKSTLLHAIAGVLHDHDGQSQSGSARIDGVAPEDARGHHRAHAARPRIIGRARPRG